MSETTYDWSGHQGKFLWWHRRNEYWLKCWKPWVSNWGLVEVSGWPSHSPLYIGLGETKVVKKLLDRVNFGSGQPPLYWTSVDGHSFSHLSWSSHSPNLVLLTPPSSPLSPRMFLSEFYERATDECHFDRNSLKGPFNGFFVSFYVHWK